MVPGFGRILRKDAFKKAGSKELLTSHIAAPSSTELVLKTQYKAPKSVPDRAPTPLPLGLYVYILSYVNQQEFTEPEIQMIPNLVLA